MTRRTLEILAICIAAVLAALAFHAWLSAHDDQLRLQSVVASQKQVLDAADAREHDRNATLKDALAQIEILKRQTQTPEQILRDLPKYLPLPQPITLAPVATATDEAAAAAAAGSPEPTSTSPAATAASAHTAAQQGTTAARETPTQILRDLAKYLHLPQPTTRTPVAPAAHASNANADAADAAASAATSTDAAAEPTTSPASTTSPAQDQEGTTLSSEPTTSPTSSSPTEPGAVSANPAATSVVTGAATGAPTGARGNSTAPTENRALSSSGIPPGQHPSVPSSPPSATIAQIPAADLKPLYDYVQDCRACQLELAAAKQNATDTALKLTALTHERDAALQASKGGPFWLRLRREALWLAVGAAAATTALCATNHCR